MPDTNIIYIHSHDTGRYVQPYGYDIPTPNIQQLAEEGVLFRKAFSAAPTCSSSRASLLTGRWAHCNGMIGLAHIGSRLHDYNQLLPHHLKSNGYHTVRCGVQHVIDHNQTQELGYDRTLDSEYFPDLAAEQFHAAGPIADAASDFLLNRQKNNAPFFLDVGFQLTHRVTKSNAQGERWFNGDSSPAGDSRYCQPPAALPDTPQTREDMADFKVCAKQLDERIGQVLDAVDQAGLRDNTLIICTTDHGIAFPGMKGRLTDHGMGVMLIMRLPSSGSAPLAAIDTSGKVVDAMVSQIDLFPTICDITNINKPTWLQGHSMMPLLSGAQDKIRDQLFAEVTYHCAYEPKRCVRTNRYKYIRRWENPGKKSPGPVLPNCDDSASKDLWLQHGWADRPEPREQLYDLVFDPNETNNLAEKNSASDLLLDMRQRLERWMVDTKDPLLKGYVDPWPAQILNDVNARSMSEKRSPAQPVVSNA